MIKSLFDEEENENTAEKAGDSTLGLSLIAADDEPEKKEIPEDAGGAREEKKEEDPDAEDSSPEAVDDSPNLLDVDEDELAAQLMGIEKELSKEQPITEARSEPSPQFSAPEKQPITELKAEPVPQSSAPMTGPDEQALQPQAVVPSEDRIAVVHQDPDPISKIDVIRNSGLAYSAAIALFGSVIFMLIMGWFVDLLLGIKPWGTVIGIVLGVIIGFLQFFRLTSQIINPKPSDFEKVSLMGQADDGVVPVPEQSVPAASANAATVSNKVLGTDTLDNEPGIEASESGPGNEAKDV